MRILIFIACFTMLLSGCADQSQQQSVHGLSELEGENCLVIYRRDALGYATDEPGISADTVFSGSAGKLAARGKLKEANDSWVVLEIETAGGLQAIPVSSILSIVKVK